MACQWFGWDSEGNSAVMKSRVAVWLPCFGWGVRDLRHGWNPCRYRFLRYTGNHKPKAPLRDYCLERIWLSLRFHEWLFANRGISFCVPFADDNDNGNIYFTLVILPKSTVTQMSTSCCENTSFKKTKACNYPCKQWFTKTKPQFLCLGIAILFG